MRNLTLLSLTFFVFWVHAQTPDRAERRDDKTVTKIQAEGESRQESNRDPRRQPMKLTDAQAMDILKAIHESDVQLALWAQKNSSKPAISSFGNQVIKDHENLMLAVSNFEKQSKMTPESSVISQEIRKNRSQTEEQLKKVGQTELDRAYLDHEATFHNNGLKIIDTDLLPQVKDVELKKLIEQTRTTMETHRQKAAYTRQTLNNPGY
jgi:putative membrane protein